MRQISQWGWHLERVELMNFGLFCARDCQYAVNQWAIQLRSFRSHWTRSPWTEMQSRVRNLFPDADLYSNSQIMNLATVRCPTRCFDLWDCEWSACGKIGHRTVAKFFVQLSELKPASGNGTRRVISLARLSNTITAFSGFSDTKWNETRLVHWLIAFCYSLVWTIICAILTTKYRRCTPGMCWALPQKLTQCYF